MNHSSETTCISNKIIGYAYEIPKEYIIRFGDFIPKLYILAKLAKDLRIWHGRVEYFGFKNLIWMSK